MRANSLRAFSLIVGLMCIFGFVKGQSNEPVGMFGYSGDCAPAGRSYVIQLEQPAGMWIGTFTSAQHDGTDQVLSPITDLNVFLDTKVVSCLINGVAHTGAFELQQDGTMNLRLTNGQCEMVFVRGI